MFIGTDGRLKGLMQESRGKTHVYASLLELTGPTAVAALQLERMVTLKQLATGGFMKIGGP